MCAAQRLCLQSGCAKACSESQSSHLPADRLKIEAVLAQLIPSHSQDKHTALYTYTHTICHSPPHGPELGGVSQMNTMQTHASYSQNALHCKCYIQMLAGGTEIRKMACVKIG